MLRSQSQRTKANPGPAKAEHDVAEGASVFWRLMPSVRAPEQDRFLFFFQLSAFLTLAQTLGLAGSEALFLERVGPSALPLAFVLAPIATVLGCLGYAAIVGRIRNDVLFCGLLASASVALAAAALLVYINVPGILYVVFCAAYLAQAVLISLHFWTFAADFFDTLQSKRLYPYLAVGASAGGVVGGAIAALSGSALPAEALIAGWSLVMLLTAVFVYRHELDLRRWRTVGFEERDESSTAGMQSAVRFLSRSPLVGWLVVSIVGMISALFVIQYIYMGIFSEAFDSAESLAVFLGVYLAVSNLVEIATGTVVTPMLLRRFGVPTANLVHPALTLLAFPLLLLNPILVSGIIARAIRELMENAMAAPIRQLAYNALPFRFRGRVRALLEGVVLFGAMATAGFALLWLGLDASLMMLGALGGTMGLLYLGASFMVRREYLRSLVTELRRGRLDLQDFDIDLGQSALTSLAEHWEALIAAEGTYPSPSVLALASELAERGLGASVLRASRHTNPRIRTTCIEALADHDPTRLTADLVELLGNKDADVRSAAVRAAIQLSPIPSDIEAGLRARLSDSDPNVRAYAAAESGMSGEATLSEMFASDDPITLVAALSCATSKQASLLERNTRHESPEVRATSISRLSQLGDVAPLNLNALERALGDPEPIVREAAAQALSKCDQSGVAKSLASALDDRSRSVRSAAASSLAALGKPGVDAALERVGSGHPGVADAALHAIATASGFDASSQLADVYRGCVVDAWTLAAGIELAPQATTLQLRFLNEAFLNAYRHKTALAFKALRLIEDDTVVRSVQRTLERGTTRDRADALEVLSNLADRDASDQFALLLETGGFLDKVTSAADFISPPDRFKDVVTAVQRNEDKWLSMATDVYLANQKEADANVAPQNTDGTDPTPIPRAEIDLMQRLLALREVPLFSKLSLDRLEAIHQLMHESEYLVGECVIREGDPGNDLYVLIEGELQIYKSHGTPAQRLLSTLTPIGYMGEIAILDGSARSATAIASKDSRLLSLGGEPFKEVVLQAPEISFEIFKVLTARVRAAEKRQG